MRSPSETIEAKALVRWVESEYPELLIAHVPNETPTDKANVKWLHAMGVRRGVPDFIVVHRRTHRVIFIELKRRKGGSLRHDQKVWLTALGKRACVCKGWHEAAEFIKDKLL